MHESPSYKYICFFIYMFLFITSLNRDVLTEVLCFPSIAHIKQKHEKEQIDTQAEK